MVTIILYPWYYAIKKEEVWMLGMDNRTPTSKNKIEEMMGSKTEF